MEERVLMNYVFNGESVAKFEKEVNDEWLANGWRVKSVSIGGEEGSSMIVFVLQKDEENPSANQNIKETDKDVMIKIEYPKSFKSEYNFLSGYKITQCDVSNVKVSQKKSKVIVNFNAKKTSDQDGKTSNQAIGFNYKVKDLSGVVISKGCWKEDNIYVDDVVNGSFTIENIPVSSCLLEFFDLKN